MEQKDARPEQRQPCLSSSCCLKPETVIALLAWKKKVTESGGLLNYLRGFFKK
jgi:hypothetical protein